MSSSFSLPFTEDGLLQEYYLVSESIKTLAGKRVMYLIPSELRDLREALLDEVKKDYSFKLITLLEARIREDFLISLRRRRRDPVSRSYRELCDQFRRSNSQVSQQAAQACRHVSLKPILDSLRDCFAATNNGFGRVCSLTKGYFSFRNWYAHGRTRTMPVVPDPDDVHTVYIEFKNNVFDR
jgi:hypothetical protein